MFLKRIEMQGFKSFADKTIINMDDEIIGVVGPNGCGKSNISDAIRFVLGEQSVKSLRGSQMSDIIFNGSEKRKGVNFAEVKLLFDNSQGHFPLAYQEVELARKISRFSGENIYTINKTNCRLKDITDLILDIGIGKDSLSIISQGNIQSFAEAKPADRRTFFEEAAGVAKYKKRKIEAEGKLERTQGNLTRLSDIVSELDNQYAPLKRQAKKADIYLKKQALLQEIEVSVLVRQISELEKQIDDTKAAIFSAESSCAAKEAQINVHDTFCLQEKENLKLLDQLINDKQQEILRVIQEIQISERKKDELQRELDSEIITAADVAAYRRLQYEYEEIKLEIADRKNRLAKLHEQADSAQSQIDDFRSQLSFNDIAYQQHLNLLNKYEKELNNLTYVQANPYSEQSGVKALSAHKGLAGIKAVVGDLIKAQPEYQQAIAAALEAALFYVLASDESSIKAAIAFLRKNESGKASFLSLANLPEETLDKESAIIAQSQKGYLGQASDFVADFGAYPEVSQSLLKAVLVCENLDQALNLGRLLKYRFKIVTLAGESLQKGGIIRGGKSAKDVNLLTITSQIENCQQQGEIVKAQIAVLQQEKEHLQGALKVAEESALDAKLNIVQLTPVIEAKAGKLTKLEYDLKTASLSGEALTLQEAETAIISGLNALYALRDEITLVLSKSQENRIALSREIENREQQIRALRRSLSEESLNLNNVKINLATAKTQVDNLLQRLASEYQLTYQAAKNQAISVDDVSQQAALQLRQDITDLGNINLDAPEQFLQVAERYETLSKELDNLDQARNELLAIIKDMDEIMKERFLAMFKEINAALPEVFRQLFGGGKAQLILDDPADLLNCGIDINVQPPGKNVSNIRLFSGGEKTLIAIAVLFAVLKIKPVPLCVLDEAESALDQVNVERFANYLKEFSATTQFIVITHRPGTMAKCNSLFGVTMTNSGVSQMLKIRLSEAIELAQEEETNGLSD